MQPPHQLSRIDLSELKDQLLKKLGPEGSKQYFHYLHRFLSSKLSKVEFNKLCLRILGRENISLHNQLIRSVLKNASTAKSPPPIHHKNEVSAADIYHNGPHKTQSSFSAALSNGGDVLSSGKVKFPHQLTGKKSSGSNVVLENGNMGPQHHQEIARKTQKNDEALVSLSHPSKVPAVSRLLLPDGSAPPVHSKGPTEPTLGNDSKQESSRGPWRASGLEVSSHGALLDGAMLRERMERIALLHGLEGGVSLDCANLVNLWLDSYLKGLIGSIIELTGHNKLQENDPRKNCTDAKLTQGNDNHLAPISLQDFRVSTESNPRQLGRDWPLQLEKISTRAFEEMR